MEAADYRQNIAILSAIVLCTTIVAYFGGGAGGLWSLLLLMGWLSPSSDDDCECETKEAETKT